MNQVEKDDFELINKLVYVAELDFKDIGRITYALLYDKEKDLNE